MTGKEMQLEKIDMLIEELNIIKTFIKEDNELTKRQNEVLQRNLLTLLKRK